MTTIVDLFSKLDLSEPEMQYILNNFNTNFVKFKSISNKRNCEIWEDRIFNGLTPEELSIKYGLSKTSIVSICKDIDAHLMRSVSMFLPEDHTQKAIDACASAKTERLKSVLKDCIKNSIEIPQEAKDLDIADLGLNILTVNCLKRNNIDTYGDLIEFEDFSTLNGVTASILHDLKTFSS